VSPHALAAGDERALLVAAFILASARASTTALMTHRPSGQVLSGSSAIKAPPPITGGEERAASRSARLAGPRSGVRRIRSEETTFALYYFVLVVFVGISLLLWAAGCTRRFGAHRQGHQAE